MGRVHYKEEGKDALQLGQVPWGRERPDTLSAGRGGLQFRRRPGLTNVPFRGSPEPNWDNKGRLHKDFPLSSEVLQESVKVGQSGRGGNAAH